MKKKTIGESLDFKNLTWGDLKKIINKMPDSRLKDEITIWADDENCYKVDGVEVLKEDYVFDGDEGCCPRSVAKGFGANEYALLKHEIAHHKGTRIINAAG